MSVGIYVLDAVVYGAAVTSIVLVGTTIGCFAFGGGWPTVKAALFVIGTLLFGYATLGLWPSTARKGPRGGPGPDPDSRSNSRSSTAVPARAETRFQRLLVRTPPLRSFEVTPAETASAPAKLFLSSLVIVAVSYAMEAVFGVGV